MKKRRGAMAIHLQVRRPYLEDQQGPSQHGQHHSAANGDHWAVAGAGQKRSHRPSKSPTRCGLFWWKPDESSTRRRDTPSPGASQGITVVGNPYTYQLPFPRGVALDAHGDLFVANNYDRVTKYPPGGATGSIVAGGNSFGPAANQFWVAEGVAVDSHDDVFVADEGNHRVQEWTPKATHGITVAGGHGQGSTANQLSSPDQLAVDGRGDVFVADVENDRVQEWTPGATKGITVAGGHGRGSAPNQLNRPTGVALDAHGDLFVADSDNNRIQEVTLPPDPTPIKQAAISISYYNTTSENQAPSLHTHQPIVLVATVKPLAGTTPAHGTVAFSDGTTELGAVPLYSNLATSYAVLFTTLDPRPHTITARYSGDDTYTPDHTEPIQITVNP